MGIESRSLTSVIACCREAVWEAYRATELACIALDRREKVLFMRAALSSSRRVIAYLLRHLGKERLDELLRRVPSHEKVTAFRHENDHEVAINVGNISTTFTLTNLGIFEPVTVDSPGFQSKSPAGTLLTMNELRMYLAGMSEVLNGLEVDAGAEAEEAPPGVYDDTRGGA
jgi:hypothetical protein